MEKRNRKNTHEMLYTVLLAETDFGVRQSSASLEKIFADRINYLPNWIFLGVVSRKKYWWRFACKRIQWAHAESERASDRGFRFALKIQHSPRRLYYTHTHIIIRCVLCISCIWSLSEPNENDEREREKKIVT